MRDRLRLQMRLFGMMSCLLLLATSSGWSEESATLVTVVGTVSTDGSDGHDADLRRRAIRNALDVALLQVEELQLSTRRSTTLTEHFQADSGFAQGTQEGSLQREFRSGSSVAASGYVRLVELIEQWQDSDGYHVRAQVEVRKARSGEVEGGFFWRRIGRPPVVIQIDARGLAAADPGLRAYFIETLSRNGIAVGVPEQAQGRYRLKVEAHSSASHYQALDAFSGQCALHFELLDQRWSQGRPGDRLRAGPTPGFSREQAEEACIRSIAEQAAEGMVHLLVDAFNEQWMNGETYRVTIDNVSDELLDPMQAVMQAVPDIMEVDGGTYASSTLSVRVRYRGGEADLAQELQAAWQAPGALSIREFGEGGLSLIWSSDAALGESE